MKKLNLLLLASIFMISSCSEYHKEDRISYYDYCESMCYTLCVFQNDNLFSVPELIKCYNLYADSITCEQIDSINNEADKFIEYLYELDDCLK